MALPLRLEPRTNPRYEVIVTKEKSTILPPGYARRATYGLFPMSQLVAATLEGISSSHGLYTVTFSPDTLAALRSGDATLMHSLTGERAVAVRLNGKVKEIGTVAETGFSVGRACFATVSLLTGQYFLARIDQKLEVILSGVQDILLMLDSAERADLHLAHGYLQALIGAVRQRRRTENDASDLRAYRRACLAIATRNLDTLEGELGEEEIRQVLGPKERAGEISDAVSAWVGNQVSRVIPSRREESLLAESRQYAERMTRGLVALQASLCLEAILEPETTSPSAKQAFSMAVRFGESGDKLRKQLQEKEKASMADFRYFKSSDKRERLKQELEKHFGIVTTHWETLRELEAHWQIRARGVPEIFYVSKNEMGSELEFFLPIDDLVDQDYPEADS